MIHDLDLKYRDGGAIGTTKSVVVDGGLTVAGAFVPSGAVTLPAASTVGGLTMADPNIALPGDHSFTAWAYDPAFASTGQLLTNGTLYLSAIRLRRPATITKVWWAHSTAGATPTSGQNFAILFSAAGAVLSSVGIDANVATSGVQNATLAVAQTNAPAAQYWVGLIFNASTAPTAVRTNGIQTGINNANISAATKRFATNGTSLTAVPASITPGSNADGASLWVAVN